MRRAVPPRLCLSLLALGACAPAWADKHVAAVGKANSSYTERRRTADGSLRRETYVLMEGKRFTSATVDRTLERMPIREIADYLAPQLTKQNYWPTPEIKDADLVLVVHWGVTHPRGALNDMTSRINLGFNPTKDSEFGQSPAVREFLGNGDLSEQPVLGGYMGLAGDTTSINLNALEQRMYQLEDIADSDANTLTGGNIVRLLGYGETLVKLSQSGRYTAEQYTLDMDLRSERYFVIVRAYELRHGTRDERSRPVWTLHLNISSPGNNFKTALARMCLAGSNLFGRSTDGVKTVRPDVPGGEVKMGELIILGEAK